MLVSKRTFRAAQEEIVRLRRELEQTQSSLAGYKAQERELLDALVSSRADARQRLSLAEAQARELVDRARAQANSAEADARELMDRARAQADDAEAQARAQISAAESEIARLREVHRELNASLQQSLAALNGIPPRADGILRATTASTTVRAASDTALAPLALKPTPAPLTGLVADQRKAERSLAAPAIPRGQPTETMAGAKRPQPLIPSWGRESSLGARRKAVIVTAGAAAIVVLAAAIGLPALWRGIGGRTVPSVESAPIPSGAPAPHAPRPAERASTPPGSPVNGVSVSTPSHPAPLTVALRAVRQVWLRADVDGKRVVARLLRAGEDLELSGTRDVVVRAGDAGAVLVAVNGRTRTALGRDGAVLTRRIAAELEANGGNTSGAKRPVAAQGQPSPLLSANVAAGRQEQEPIHPVTPAVAPQPYRVAPVPPPEPPPAPSTESSPEPSTQPSAVPSTEEADVLRAHGAYFEALRTGDGGQMSRLVADGFSASGAPAADESGLPYEISLRSASVEVHGVGAVVSGTASQHIPDGQFLRDQPLRFSEVWIKRNGQWQLMNVRFLSPGGTR